MLDSITESSQLQDQKSVCECAKREMHIKWEFKKSWEVKHLRRLRALTSFHVQTRQISEIIFILLHQTAQL